MGLIIEVSPRMSVELRRESYRLIPDETGNPEGNIELHYNTLFALEATVAEVKKSEQFQLWLYKQENRRRQKL